MKNKTITISVPEDEATEIEHLKQEQFMDKSDSELIEILIREGLSTITAETREFDTSFFIIVIQILCLSHLRLIFFVKFYDFMRAFLCFLWYNRFDWRFSYVYQYHWQQR